MYRKKTAIYVEGQTEQYLLNHLIRTWWANADIQIVNIKLKNNEIAPCNVISIQSPLWGK